MKFLCVTCDEPMKLKQTVSAEQDSLSVLFVCPACGWEMAMLTNPMETQMVRSLGVKIGGPVQEPRQPMQHLRQALQGSVPPVREASPAGDQKANPAEGSGRCPFADTLSATPPESQMPWTPEAEARLANIPAFVRPMARKSIEQLAREKGYTCVDEEVLNLVKDQFGM